MLFSELSRKGQTIVFGVGIISAIAETGAYAKCISILSPGTSVKVAIVAALILNLLFSAAARIRYGSTDKSVKKMSVKRILKGFYLDVLVAAAALATVYIIFVF